MENINSMNGNVVSTSSNNESLEQNLNILERTLEQFQVIVLLIFKKCIQENARHMGVLASDFVLKSQEPLNQKIHTMTSGLQVFYFRNNRHFFIKLN